MSYLKSPSNCTPHDPNPFAKDGMWGTGWTGLALVEDGPLFVGTSRSGLFHYGCPLKNQRAAAIVADFIRYENAHGRTPILFSSKEIDVDAWVQHALAATLLPHVLRDTDPEFLVHSTSLDAGRRILRDGQIKSFARLAEQGEQPGWHKLRSSSLGEPPDYDLHVNLGSMDDPWVETMPGSHVAGRFLGPDDPYVPGFRFYFPTRKIVEAGLDVRVAGAIRVFDSLPLDPFLAAALCVEDADPTGTASAWTPRSFTARANELFRSRLIS